jgi:hypothetical protein
VEHVRSGTSLPFSGNAITYNGNTPTAASPPPPPPPRGYVGRPSATFWRLPPPAAVSARRLYKHTSVPPFRAPPATPWDGVWRVALPTKRGGGVGAGVPLGCDFEVGDCHITARQQLQACWASGCVNHTADNVLAGTPWVMRSRAAADVADVDSGKLPKAPAASWLQTHALTRSGMLGDGSFQDQLYSRLFRPRGLMDKALPS